MNSHFERETSITWSLWAVLSPGNHTEPLSPYMQNGSNTSAHVPDVSRGVNKEIHSSQCLFCPGIKFPVTRSYFYLK